MKGMIDESVPRLLAKSLAELGLDVSSFPREWKGLKNGELLDRIELSGFDCLITCDANLRFQQDFRNRAVGLAVLPFQQLHRLLPIAPNVVEALRNWKPRSVTDIAKDGSFTIKPLV